MYRRLPFLAIAALCLVSAGCAPRDPAIEAAMKVYAETIRVYERAATDLARAKGGRDAGRALIEYDRSMRAAHAAKRGLRDRFKDAQFTEENPRIKEADDKLLEAQKKYQNALDEATKRYADDTAYQEGLQRISNAAPME